MTEQIEYQDLGVMDYQEAWDYQEERLNQLVEYKRNPGGKKQP